MAKDIKMIRKKSQPFYEKYRIFCFLFHRKVKHMVKNQTNTPQDKLEAFK